MEKFWIPILFSAFSSSVLALWNLFQQWKLQQLKRDAEKQVFIHQLQFENEFKIYDELWRNLIDLRAAISALQPIMDRTDEGKTYGETIQRRVSEAAEIGNKTIDLIERRKPFYDHEVYEKLKEVLKIVRAELAEVNTGQRQQADYWKNRMNTAKQLIPLTDAVCDAIRRRINLNM